MSNLLRFISFSALALLLVSAVLCAGGRILPDTNRSFILAGTIVWFVVTPIWLRKNK